MADPRLSQQLQEYQDDDDPHARVRRGEYVGISAPIPPTTAIAPREHAGGQHGDRVNVYRGDPGQAQRADEAAMSYQARAVANRMLQLQNTALDRSRTPEELRTEQFRRVADRLQHYQFQDPGVFAAAAGRSGIASYREAGAWTRPQIELADRVQSLRYDAIKGDRVAYDTLQRYQEANQALQNILLNGELSRNDLEKLRRANDEMIINALGMGMADVTNKMNMLRARPDYWHALQMGAAEIGVSEKKLIAIGNAFSSGGATAGMITAKLFGAYPTAEQMLVGHAIEAIGAQGRGLIRTGLRGPTQQRQGR